MVKRNLHFSALAKNYLFPEVARRVKLYKERHPEAELISLSVGDTSEPISQAATEAFITEAQRLGTKAGYRGYGPEQGDPLLRKQLAEILYSNCVNADEIFISDGAKCEIGRLQLLFGQTISIGLQNPTYPVYSDASTMVGVQKISLLPCREENDFFPTVSELPKVDLLYLCSPNNPTGAAATKKQLTELVQWAKVHRTILIFDTAYAGFIQDPALPRSIYEIPGAKEVAIEISSSSKWMGFSGVRLGWTIVPKALCYDSGESLYQDYTRLITTCFNGASLLSQAGALGALSPEGMREICTTLTYYMENAQLIKKSLENQGLKVYGGENAPYLWTYFGAYDSWDLFQHLLETTGVIATPGSGFGSEGQGFLRFSALGPRERILRALEKLSQFTLPVEPVFN